VRPLSTARSDAGCSLVVARNRNRAGTEPVRAMFELLPGRNFPVPVLTKGGLLMTKFLGFGPDSFLIHSKFIADSSLLLIVMLQLSVFRY
jgi:hypothetical protein